MSDKASTLARVRWARLRFQITACRWYVESENTGSLVHDLCRVIQKQQQPRIVLSDNGSASAKPRVKRRSNRSRVRNDER